jgi:hypothetical protein
MSDEPDRPLTNPFHDAAGNRHAFVALLDRNNETLQWS